MALFSYTKVRRVISEHAPATLLQYVNGIAAVVRGPTFPRLLLAYYDPNLNERLRVHIQRW